MRNRARPPWWRLVEWRVVAMVGLPFWAAAGGVALGHKSRPAPAVTVAPPAVAPVEPSAPPVSLPGGPLLWFHLAQAAAPSGVSPRPDPQMLGLMAVDARVRRAEATAAEARRIAAPPKKPDGPPDEIDGCKTFKTYVAWRHSPADAMRRAAEADKLTFVLHLSGDLDDPGFT
jgi:hypothetical protein